MATDRTPPETLIAGLKVSEIRVTYPLGYEHPDPNMRWMLREIEALTPLVEQAKRGTEHEACEGWGIADGHALCGCGGSLDEVLGVVRHG